MPKQFKNPALNFITTDEEEQEETKAKVQYINVEARSKRVQLLVQPSVYKKIKNKADKEGISFNELVHRILEREEA